MNGPRILVYDTETAPITAYTWGLYDQNVGLNQIKTDWHFLAYAAKWYGEPASKTIYKDNSKAKDITDDKEIVASLSKLLEEADIVITQNGDKFDRKKFNARAAIHGLPPIKELKSVDLLKESRKVFAFTSHKLEYMTEKLNKKYKKLKHEEYPGFELWKEVLKGNQHAWHVMRTYCIHDVLATEELYMKLQGWIKTQNVSRYLDDALLRCQCGSPNLIKKGFVYTEVGKFQGYKCMECGKRPRSRVNLLSKEKRTNLLKEGK